MMFLLKLLDEYSIILPSILQVDNPRADWAVIAAFNSFQAYQHGQLGKVQRFATIGTGSGTDVIAALETFPELESVAMTDLHQSVVDVAKRNVLGAITKSSPEANMASRIFASAGDLISPLKGQEPFDLIYEYVFFTTSKTVLTSSSLTDSSR